MKPVENPKGIWSMETDRGVLKYDTNNSAFYWNGEWCERIIVKAVFPIEHQVIEKYRLKSVVSKCSNDKMRKLFINKVELLAASIEVDQKAEMSWK